MSYKKLCKILSIAVITFLSLYGCATNRSQQAAEQPATMTQAKMAYDAGNFEDAAEMLRPLAENGNADAQYSLGYLYFYGKGVPQDRAQGKFWIRKAAEQNQKLAVRALQQINQDEQNAPPRTAKKEKAPVQKDLQ